MKNLKLIHFSLRILSFAFLVLVFLHASYKFLPKSYAQVDSSGVAVYVEIKDNNPPVGSLVSFSQSGYILSKQAYDPTSFAVIVSSPAASYEEKIDGAFPVVSQGKAEVRVSSTNGSIKTGDLLTASKLPGVAQKVSQDGYVIGTAQEDYNSTDPETIGKILVSLNFGFNTQATGLRSNLLDNLDIALKTPFLSPASTFRYILAGLIVLISLILGLWFFGKVAAKGVEALGRNPLASSQILAGIAFNLVLSLATLGIGLAIAYLILIL